jgi:hypothetical protein
MDQLIVFLLNLVRTDAKLNGPLIVNSVVRRRVGWAQSLLLLLLRLTDYVVRLPTSFLLHLKYAKLQLASVLQQLLGQYRTMLRVILIKKEKCG